MLNPDLRPILKNRLSKYSLVIATAKRARDIADDMIEKNEIITEKPVSLAIEEIIGGDYVVVEPEELKNI
ncbi:MAG TPA: DNA-directed RNA polymerase subunit omega [Clostridiales bacterium]|jgi:DNA-directed RNA polymerase subunit omega|nr:DNA-directed RNA polymerase subunit omega [Clostridiales bacterium]